MTSIYEIKPDVVLKKSPGTYNYTAPEVMELKPHGLPIDVYSFGMTMYHMFSYERPFDDMDPMQIQQFVCSGKVAQRCLTRSGLRSGTSSRAGWGS